MKQALLTGGLFTCIAVALACGGAIGGKKSTRDACLSMFEQVLDDPPKDWLLNECEVFYTHHASPQQKNQLECIASEGLGAVSYTHLTLPTKA